MCEQQTMENGTYQATDRAYGSARKVIVFNGKATVYTPNGAYVCTMSIDQVEECFYNFRPEDRSNKLYNLAWMVSGNIKEIVVQNASYAVCKHKMNVLKDQYKGGLLMPIPSHLS